MGVCGWGFEVGGAGHKERSKARLPSADARQTGQPAPCTEPRNLFVQLGGDLIPHIHPLLHTRVERGGELEAVAEVEDAASALKHALRERTNEGRGR